MRIERSDGKWMGSGTIISPDGYILTNFHVIEGFSTANVLVQDTYMFPGNVVGYDEGLDLAIIKISGGPWAYLEVTEHRPDVGDEVIMIGYALDLPGQASITKGIVSAIRPGTRLTWIQTDAAGNPGISGGTAVNSTGQFIGVPTWGYSEAENVGFFIALFSVADEIPRLRAGASVASSAPTATSRPTATSPASAVPPDQTKDWVGYLMSHPGYQEKWGTPKYGGIIRTADPTTAGSWNITLGWSAFSKWTFAQYNSLLMMDPWLEIDQVVSCDLCESYEVSADGKTYTFKLRQGVKFHSEGWGKDKGAPAESYGAELTCEDIKSSMEWYANPPAHVSPALPGQGGDTWATWTT